MKSIIFVGGLLIFRKIYLLINQLNFDAVQIQFKKKVLIYFKINSSNINRFLLFNHFFQIHYLLFFFSLVVFSCPSYFHSFLLLFFCLCCFIISFFLSFYNFSFNYFIHDVSMIFSFISYFI
ncbi:transmembrane protein, putative (macronuclear) [Tetrahymena thermophila SB210]|uniref:Transmembrane protein, putative n=1 Tax=Tetrahymena thermophila (strain SB210) TaxID=312017 RepID=W7X7Z7_TETTS|nr:transmembrane protein, putative [Tetrahymena thermophila SB210]EWS73462.1 transmembrane protein, putative [Tetrahymena thermophila SB210]|eukprot:XP_012653998.1 transmembrane protein, putative [Tetrahymena thermophila SB210]